MKKVLVIMALAIGLVSCEKEEDKPCNCGTILNDGINGSCYWLEIKNDCSGNRKTFCFDQSVWTSAYVGSNFCVTNQTQW
tara:strand:- start:8 stop:247 length:240 start_codon:yes stop_codon:yes gene_type:complete